MKNISKKLLGVAMATAAAVTVASCANNKDVFHIYAWNQEFQGFFNKYVSDEKTADAKTYHLDGKEVKWTIVTNDGGKYQKALDKALKNNKKAAKGDKVDMFLAEADYILKYTDSEYTKDVRTIGVTDFSNTYEYTVQAASDSNGTVKGVSFQCCPSGLIYRRSIAEAVLGTSDPAEVQDKLDTWAKFDSVATKAKNLGYYMTASYAASYRVFSNNASTPWVNANNELSIPAEIETWMEQAEKHALMGYTKTDGIWAEGTKEMDAKGKAMCYFGPAWYYNFSMGPAMGEGDNHEGGSYGDWAVIKGPQAHFWGGTWMLATTDGDDDELVKKTMNAFINDEAVCTALIENEAQFTNNKTVNEAYAQGGQGNAFLNGQNDTQIWVDMAEDIQFRNITIYDQLCNEGLQTEFVKYLKEPNKMSKQDAIDSFYAYITQEYPTLTIKK